MEQGCDIEGDSQNPEMLLIQRQEEEQKALRLKRLQKALKTLPPAQAGTIHKHFFLKMSFAQIAKEENVDESAIRRRIKRALKNLKKLF